MFNKFQILIDHFLKEDNSVASSLGAQPGIFQDADTKATMAIVGGTSANPKKKKKKRKFPIMRRTLSRAL
jgi:hypothetical protein